MNERNEITVARLRCGLSIAVAARAAGVDETRLDRFENVFYALTAEEITTLRDFYADFLTAVDESNEFPNVFDAGTVKLFVGAYRRRREVRQRQQKFLDDNLLTPCLRPDPVKIAKHNAETELETARRILQKAKNIASRAKAEIALLAK